jgi:drug/metabolite transporter (DMT)-like permease
MLTVLSGLLTALSYSSSDMLSQHITRKTRPLTQMVWVMGFGAIVIIPLALLLKGLPGPGEWRGAGLAALAGVLYFGALLSLFKGLNTGDLGLVSALASLQSAYVALVVIALGEPVTPLLAVGLVLCVCGAVLASFEGRAKSARGASWAILSGILFSGVLLCYAYGDLDWLSQAAISRGVSLLVAVPVALITGSVVVPKALRVTALGAGALEVCGLLLLTITFALGPPTIAAVTTSQFGTFGVLLGYLLLRERPRPNQWAGIVCTIAGVSVLTAVV